MAFAQTPEQELFTEAESFYFSKNYGLALESYQEFSDNFKQSELYPDVQFHLALCYFYLEQYEESLAVLEKTERRFRSTKFLQFIPFWKGMNRYRKKEYIPALEDFTKYLEFGLVNNITEQAVYYKAVCESEVEDYKTARTTAGAYLSKYPNTPLFHYSFVLMAYINFKTEKADDLIGQHNTKEFANLPPALKNKFLLYYADALIVKNQTQSAKDIYNSLLAETPDISGVALAKLFTLAMKSKQLKEMERLIRIAEDTFADNPAMLVDFWTNIGIASFSDNNMEQAEYYFNRAWGFRNRIPIPVSVPLYLSEILIKKGSAQYAAKILQEYQQLFKEQSDTVLFRTGSLSVQAGDFETAINILEQHLHDYPASPNKSKAAYTLAYALYKTGKTEPAIVLTTGLLADNNQEAGIRRAAVKLHSKLLVQRGEISQAKDFLSGYIKSSTDDLQAQRDYVYILFQEKNYSEVVSRVAKVNQASPRLKTTEPVLYTIFKYFEGLSFVSLKQYKNALASFSEIQIKNTDDPELGDIAPFVVFYKGWAYYRLGDFDTASGFFTEMISAFPEHELAEQALYYNGWCFYSAGNYRQSARYFDQLAQKTKDAQTLSKAQFFLAKSELSQGNSAKAEKLFLDIWKKSSNADFADDALFEYAGILALQGKTAQAADAYLSLSNNYSSSPLHAQALYNRAELYYSAGSFMSAKSAFEQYQSKFPDGDLIDASLYWAGNAALQVKNKPEALRHWETLIKNHGKSPFRSEAMKQSAQIYMEQKAYDKALALYQDIIAWYPKEAEAMKASETVSELRYLVLGLSGEEARLTALIDRSSKTATPQGRTAMNDLAALYLKGNDSSKWETAVSLISQVLRVSSDKKTGARAQYLMGEYYNRKKDFKQAGNEFLKAAFVDSSNQDLMAESIYRAAEMMTFSGDKQAAKDLVDRLVQNFPSSPWTQKGKKLIGGGN
ncbi:MAG: tetratricopeptide repeat protein [Spirochaetales bacterium]|nr:tetratricopeptide repeat protein [Spirochaetales bacterium]